MEPGEDGTGVYIVHTANLQRGEPMSLSPDISGFAFGPSDPGPTEGAPRWQLDLELDPLRARTRSGLPAAQRIDYPMSPLPPTGIERDALPVSHVPEAGPIKDRATVPQWRVSV